jgi:hypothetical protein
MLPLLLALSLTHVDAAAPTPEPAEEPAEATVPPVDLLPGAEAGGEAGLGPAPSEKQAAPETPVTRRVLFSGAAGVAASFAGLGLAVALTGQNPGLDTNFSTAMVSPLLITGVAFMVHQALGGRGEVILSYAVTLAMMAGAAALAAGIDGRTPFTPVLTTLIGTLPAAVGAVWVLEATTGTSKRSPHLALVPTGVAGVF